MAQPAKRWRQAGALQSRPWSLGARTSCGILVTTLAEIGQKYVANKDIHFLKIDVEGLETKVLLGNDWSQYRPWIVLVEATVPMSTEENHSACEAILLSADYTFAYADGLNRFYVAKEHAELLNALNHPPNVFDDFVSSRQLETEHALRSTEIRAIRAEEELGLVYKSHILAMHSPVQRVYGSVAKTLSVQK